MECGIPLMAGVLERFVRRSSSGTKMARQSFQGRDTVHTRYRVQSRNCTCVDWVHSFAYDLLEEPDGGAYIAPTGAVSTFDRSLW
jgi:hypothetical protein